MQIQFYSIDRIHTSIVLRDSGFVMAEDHYHPYYELYYVNKGACCFFLKDTLYDMKTGDFILVPPGELHHTLYLPDTACERITVYFNRDDLLTRDFPLLSTFEERFVHPAIFSVPDLCQEQVVHILNQMLAEEKLLDSSSPYMLRLLLHQLFLTCDRLCTTGEDMLTRITSNDSGVIAAAKYISAHFTENLTLEEVAGIAGLSPTYFSKKFKATTGLGFREYVTFARLKRATMELLTTNNSITDIALNCGFNDSNYFKDAFKKSHGMSPRDFRKVGNSSGIIPD